MNPQIVLFLLLITAVDRIYSEQIIVHVIPHSHDDAGWLWTFDEYFYGNNTSKCVKCILDGTLESLLSDPRRTFVEVEIAFFSKWYLALSEEKKNLVKSGRWEFANAGWVMHDEATTYYQHFVDNMRLGLQFIQKEFNKSVETAWFIDPFGHSSSNVYNTLM
jgi:alpha-mannosidase